MFFLQKMDLGRPLQTAKNKVVPSILAAVPSTGKRRTMRAASTTMAHGTIGASC